MSYPPFIFSLVHAKLYQRSDYILLNISPTPYPRYLRISRNRTFLENIEFSSELLFQNISISSSWKISLRILLCTDDYNFNKFLLSSLIYFKSWIKKNNSCTNKRFFLFFFEIYLRERFISFIHIIASSFPKYLELRFISTRRGNGTRKISIIFQSKNEINYSILIPFFLNSNHIINRSNVFERLKRKRDTYK